MNKFILIDKQQGQSSFDVIRKLKKELNHSSFGHTGTLDPLATGLLVVAYGKEALKAIRFVNAEDKEYIATLQLGSQTDTGDITGDIIKSQKVNDFSNWKELFQSLIGKQLQKPPIYSAKKVNGKKAYQLARSGQTVELKAVEVEIKELKLIQASENEITFRALVSKGTFIRTLCEEIAAKSKNVGTMSKLRRTKVGHLSVLQASVVEKLLKKSFVDIKDVITLERVDITKEHYLKIQQGQRFFLEQEGTIALFFEDELVSVVDNHNERMSILRNFNLKK